MLIERDLTRRALAVLTPWLGASRVSVQVTATLDEREIRQTVEQVRSASPARPGGKTVRITRLPQGRIERIQAIVILGFEADAAVRQRAGQLARQALGLQPARGDSLGVYVLPVRPADVPAAAAASASGPPARPIPQRPSPVVPLAAPAQPAVPPEWIAAAAGAALLLGALAWLRSRRAPGLAAPEVAPDTLDQELDQARSQVLADPRVTADVIRLWMRA
jgi:flagellar M-ring protein FliF